MAYLTVTIGISQSNQGIKVWVLSQANIKRVLGFRSFHTAILALNGPRNCWLALLSWPAVPFDSHTMGISHIHRTVAGTILTPFGDFAISLITARDRPTLRTRLRGPSPTKNSKKKKKKYSIVCLYISNWIF